MADQTEIRRFLRAARQREGAAGALLKAGWNWEAMYIAGYVAECALKAMVLAATPQRRRSAFIKSHFRGARGHSLEWLKERLHRRGYNMSGALAEQFRRVATWSTDFRYQVGFVPTEEASAMLAAATAIRQWAERSL